MELEVPYNLSEDFNNADGKFFKKIGNVFMQGAFVAPRASFLAIVRLNPLGIASRFAAGFIPDPNFNAEAVAKAKPRWEKFKVTWRKLGGSVSRLEKQIKKGYKLRPIQRVDKIVKEALGKKTNFTGNYSYSNLTGAEESAAIILQAVTVALPIIVAAINNQKGIGKPFTEGKGPQDINVEVPVESTGIETDAQGNPIDPATGKPIEDDKILGMPKPVAYIGGFLAFAGLVTGAIFGINKYQKNKAAKAGK